MTARQMLATSVCLLLIVACQAVAAAINFQDPVGWSVGDADSTFQEWDTAVSAYSLSATPPSSSNVNPAISSPPALGATPPAFVAGSGGYYSFEDYQVSADVFNHGGSAGIGGPYSGNHGTRIYVQTSATMNVDVNDGGPASVFPDRLEIVMHDGSPLTGGDNGSALQVTQLFLGEVITSFGLVPLQELLFEFWLPGYTDDFRVQFESISHTSLLHLRVDSSIVEATGIDPNFDAMGSIDGFDFLTWQRDPETYGGAAGLEAWEQAFGTPPGGNLAAVGVPEPTATILLLSASLGFGVLRRSCRCWPYQSQRKS